MTKVKCVSAMKCYEETIKNYNSFIVQLYQSRTQEFLLVVFGYLKPLNLLSLFRTPTDAIKKDKL